MSRLLRVKDIVDLYFEPHGAFKMARWEAAELGSFSAESAMSGIRRALTEPELWHHVKRGTNYKMLIRSASFQCSTMPGLDQKPLVVYQSVDDRSIYGRLHQEFFDGRFVREPT